MTQTISREDLPRHVKDHICFAVYSTALAIGRAYQPLLQDLGLSYPQYMALTALWESDGLTVGALGEILKLETNTLTPLLKRLETQGYIERRRGRDDERKVFLWLTQKGRDIEGLAPEITRCIVEGTDMDLATLETLVKDLSQLRDRMLSKSGKRSK